jgi:hypothetical protein
MGLGNSPAVRPRLMDTVLRGMGKFARGYMDDIIIFSNTFEEHCEHLRIVLHKLREHKLTISPTKAKIPQSETRYCSFKVSAEAIGMVSKKVSAISPHPSHSERNYRATTVGFVLRVG